MVRQEDDFLVMNTFLGNSPDRGTELCSVVEYMFSLEELYEIFGTNTLADRLEQLAYNSLPGTETQDMWAHQYDQQSNQVLVSADKRDWISNGNYSNIYGLMPTYGCCLANMHQGWPKFVESMWMATNDNGLALVTYGPSIVKAKVGNGKEVTITEQTDYPFKGSVKLIIGTTSTYVKFPLSLRIPGWADSASVTYNYKTVKVKGGSEFRLTNRWKNGDVVQIEIPMNLRAETRYNNSVTILRGPLCFSLQIDKEYKSIKTNYDNFGYKGSIDWEIKPMSPWNYGLMIDKNMITRGFKVIENKIGNYPFGSKGDMVWSADSGKYIRLNEDPPVVITARGIIIPEWKLKNNSADLPPASPVKPVGDPQVIRLIPYGSAKLRITEFPVMNIFMMEDIMRQGK